MAMETIACQFCGKEIAKSGIKNHEKACALKHIKEDEVVEEIIAKPVEESVKTVVEEAEPIATVIEEPIKKVELVKVALNQNLTCNIAGILYSFDVDTEYEVPVNVKNILVRAGMLKFI